MEDRNSAAESQTSDQSQPIQELDGGSNTVGGPSDAVGAADGGLGLEAELGNGGGGTDMVKKKRGRPPRAQAKSPPVKIVKEEDEDVCFICFDGGSLVLCDRRGCPKAYHPACVKRDDAFFQSKAKWNCGWHICSICEKAAHHMCYTCTYSLCKGCVKKADYVCVKGDKGFCTVCMKTIMLIENDGQEKDEKARVDFDDKTSWEYLFKVYWVYLKGKLSLTLDDLTRAKNPSPPVHNGDSNLNPEPSESKRRKTDGHIKIPEKEPVITKKTSTEWATKELLDFVAHMKNGDTSLLSQFDVQELMLEYIKRNNLRDPRKKSQIMCDSRLKILFGKPRVGHFEMLKLLEFHFFIEENHPKSTINSIAKHVDPDWNIDNNTVTVGKDKKRKNHKKIEERAPQNKLDEYAAIDVHNMNWIYLRRKLMENLVENSEEFEKKVVGSIVRIRISGSDQKHDMYRLVQIVGTSKADASYKIGDKSTDVVLEVLNLDKKETVQIDTISNQDLSEDECRRLRQSIRCGLVKRFTVGEIQDKAVSLQSVRLNDLMEAETLRLNNLRDRASEKGHKKSLREYVEKLQRLKTPEERERRLREIPEIHSDPKMNPDYETDDTEEYFNKENGESRKPKYTGISRKTTNSHKKRADFSSTVGSSYKNEEGSTKAIRRINTKKDVRGSSSSGQPQNQVDHNGSTITNRNPETATKNTAVNNDSEIDKVWHYRDPNGKIQGPFCMVQLQKWSTTGYFPQDMKIWKNREDEWLLLNDVLKQQLNNKTVTDKKMGIRIEGLTVRTTNLLPIQDSVNHGKSREIIGNTGSFGKSNESNMPEMASPTPIENNGNIVNVAVVDLPSPTPKTPTTREDEKVQNVPKMVVEEVKNVGGSQLPETGNEWSGYSPTRVKREEWHPDNDGVVTSTSSIEKVILPPSSQPECSYLQPWQGVRETIEFSTLAEESVSDLLAEVDAMESQNGFPSPTSKRNNFVDDLFTDEFSPTPKNNTFDAFTTTASTTAQDNSSNVFDFIKNSADLQFKWPEANEAERETKTGHVQIEEPAVQMRPDHNASDSSHESAGGSNTHNEGGRIEPTTVQSAKVDSIGPPPPPPPPQLQTPPLSLANGLDKVYPRQATVNTFGRPVQEITTQINPHSSTSRGVNLGWDPHQRTFIGDNRYSNNSPRERSYKVDDPGYSRNGKPWVRQSSFGVGVGGGYSRQPPNGKRVCKFFESGRCKKGASCNYWHP